MATDNNIPGQSPATGPFPQTSYNAQRLSDALQANIIDVNTLANGLSQANGSPNLLKVLEHLSASTPETLIGLNDPNRSVVARAPFIFTCQSWLDEGKAIQWRCNPGDVQWHLPQRSVEEKTRRGTVLHVWKDPIRGTFYDEPVLTFSLQSGNIMPMRSGAAGSNNGEDPWAPATQLTQDNMPQGLGNFYMFLKLVDEQKIVTDPKSPSFGKVNLVYVIYNSNIFPSLTLSGLFTPTGTTWNDNAENPNQVNYWTTEFTVYDSFPRISDYQMMVQVFTEMQYRDYGRSIPIPEAAAGTPAAAIGGTLPPENVA
jgi:hypothetical protein